MHPCSHSAQVVFLFVMMFILLWGVGFTGISLCLSTTSTIYKYRKKGTIDGWKWENGPMALGSHAQVLTTETLWGSTSK